MAFPPFPHWQLTLPTDTNLLGCVVVVFLDPEVVHPDQLAVSSDLEFKCRNSFHIDFNLEDDGVTPAETFCTFRHAVSFFRVDRFLDSQRQRIERNIVGKQKKRHRYNEQENDQAHLQKYQSRDKIYLLFVATNGRFRSFRS